MERHRRQAIRRIVGNLDCEVEFARAHARRRGQDARGFDLPGGVRAKVASLATLLRVFAGPGDRLWTPLPVDASRLPELPGLPTPELESGPLSSLEEAAATLAWGASPHLVGATTPPADAAAPWPELWSLPSPFDAAVTVNHRSFVMDARRELGLRLEGARLVRSWNELQASLGGAAATAGSWVLKVPFSAAARDQVRGHGASCDEPRARRQAKRLLELHGSLLLEPWFERVADFGSCAWASENDVKILGMHRTDVDAHGRFGGITLAADRAAAPGMRAAERMELERVARGVGGLLQRRGYRGPFGIDAWRYVDGDGVERFQPLGEINARMTFGLVARALAERLGKATGHDADTRLALRPGKAEGAARSPESPTTLPATLPLLLASDADPTAVCLEVGGPFLV